MSEIETIETEIKTEIDAIEAKFSPAIKAAENDAKVIGAAALSYIDTNGLKDLYTIAMSVLAGAATGTPWATTMAAVVTQGEAAGISIAKGAESVVLAQAQADMIAAGTLLPPVATAPVASSPESVPAPTPAPAPVAETAASTTTA